MVRDRITDGYRVAELLASEVDGRRSGPLGRLAVANADRSVTGTPEGERAYDVRFLETDRDPRREPPADDAGRPVATVFVHDEGASVVVVAGVEAAAEAARASDLAVERVDESVALDVGPDAASASPGGGACSPADGAVPATLRLEYGAQVKRAADALAAASSAIDPGRADGHDPDWT